MDKARRGSTASGDVRRGSATSGSASSSSDASGQRQYYETGPRAARSSLDEMLAGSSELGKAYAWIRQNQFTAVLSAFALGVLIGVMRG